MLHKQSASCFSFLRDGVFLIADLIIVARRRNSSNELNKGERLSDAFAFAFAASCSALSLSVSLGLVTARAVRWVIHCQRADIKWPSARNTLSGIDIIERSCLECGMV